jgi:hypothetical protein
MSLYQFDQDEVEKKKERDRHSENDKEQIRIITSLAVKRLERFSYSFFLRHVNRNNISVESNSSKRVVKKHSIHIIGNRRCHEKKVRTSKRKKKKEIFARIGRLLFVTHKQK